MDRILTPRRVALLWLFLMTSCAPLQHQAPLPSPPQAVQAGPAVCTAWTGTTLAWPILSSLIAQQLEQQRLAACVAPPAEPATPLR
jgi:hypothetical protein